MQRRPLFYRKPNVRMRPRRASAFKVRLFIGLVMAGFALFSYLSSKKYNPVTGENQYISITPRQEIAMGLQAAPKMIAQYGGLFPNQKAQDLIDAIGMKLVRESEAKQTEWNYDFHLLADSKTVNAFALPGGQVFITNALFSRLKTRGQLAGVLGHEIAHVIARHSAQRLAKQQLTQGLIGSILIGSGGERSTAQAASMIGNMINMKYGREDEIESDTLGVQFMSEAGFDPRGMIQVMKVLAEASGGIDRQADFFSTHPSPANRINKIKNAISKQFPNGVPDHLIK